MTRYLFTCSVLMLNIYAQDIDDAALKDEYDRNITSDSRIKTIYNTNNGTVQFDNYSSTLLLKCHSSDLISDVIPPFKTTISASQLLIDQCVIPVTPLVETLRALNINTSVNMLELGIPNTNPLPPGNYTQGLKLQSLWIDAQYLSKGDVLSNNPSFLEPLTSSTTATVWLYKPPLPEVLSLGRDALARRWKRCNNLWGLRIYNLDHESFEIPTHLLANCSRLYTISLKGLTTTAAENVVSSVTAACRNLNTLYVHSCNLTRLPSDILHVAKNLVHLNLSRNRIIDQSFADFPVMRNLTHLDLSSNHLIGWFLNDLARKLPALVYLNLNSNQFTDLYCGYRGFYTVSIIPSLEWLSISDMPLNAYCLSSLKFQKLQFLGLATTLNTYNLSPGALPKTNSTHLEVDLRGGIVSNIGDFLLHTHPGPRGSDPSGYPAVRSNTFGNTNLTVHISYLDCDCKHYWLARFLREAHQQFLTFPGARCRNTHREFRLEPLDNMNCLKNTWGDCVIRQIGAFHTEVMKENRATADCHNGKDKVEISISRDFNLIGVNVSDGLISTIQNISPLPDTVQWVDLRNNNISRLDEDDIARLFPHAARRVWLKGNKIFCDCANKPLLDALHQHRRQVVDFDELICFETGALLQSVTSLEVCHVRLRVTVEICGVLTVLWLVVGVVLWRYRLPVQIYLYSRGWCLFCLREDDELADRPYDAFLSFAHGDDQYVMEQLLPKLEGAPDHYRVCVHYRDWAVGDWIPTQVMRSVQQSKRTIVVLSHNFLSSQWAALELKFALASERDGRSRLLVIVLDDVLSSQLDAELQGYLAYNTYLRCNDPWFWDKLRYAMPRRNPPTKRLVKLQAPDARRYLPMTSSSSFFCRNSESEFDIELETVNSTSS